MIGTVNGRHVDRGLSIPILAPLRPSPAQVCMPLDLFGGGIINSGTEQEAGAMDADGFLSPRRLWGDRASL